MAKQKLTKRVIDALTYEGDEKKNQRFVVMDTELTGFGVRVYPSGKKCFIVRYKNAEGRDRLKTLGEYGPLTLSKARQEALKLMAEVVDGVDPVAEARSRRSDNLTFNELGEIFIEEWSKPRKKSWEFDKDRFGRHLKPTLGNRAASSIGVRDLSNLHRSIGEKHHFEANRVLSLASVIFNYGIKQELLPADFENPALKIDPFDEPERDQVVTEEEMPALWAAIDKEGNPYVRAAFKLAFLTAGRKSEILNLRWEHVDLEKREILFLDTKNGTDHLVPLSSLALGILDSLDRREGNPFVLCGRVQGRPLTTWTKRWNKVRDRAGLDEDVQPRDLRRSAATWIVELGFSQLTVAHLLNHKIKSVTGVYIKRAKVPEEVRRAVEALGVRLEEALAEPNGKKEGGKS